MNELLAVESRMRADPRRAAREALALARAAHAGGKPLAEATALKVAANALLLVGEIARAEAFARRARFLCKEGGGPPGLQAGILACLGATRRRLGDYRGAHRAFEAALAQARRAEHRSEEVRILNNVGIMFFELREFGRALGYFERALASAPAAGRTDRACLYRANLGCCLRELGRGAQAEAELRRAIEEAETAGDRLTEGMALDGLGSTLAARGQAEEAESAFRRALELLDGLGAPLYASEAAMNLAELLMDLGGGAGDEAESLLETWIEPVESIGEPAKLIRLHRLRSRACAARGKYRCAYEELEAAARLERDRGQGAAEAQSYSARLERSARRAARLTDRLSAWKDLTIRSLGALIETRDAGTKFHVDRTAEIILRVAKGLAESGTRPITKEEIAILYSVAPLHDIGKIAVPDSILSKPGPLDPEERALMRRHAEVGLRVFTEAAPEFAEEPYLAIASEVAGYHHERWDGSGYPVGLAGESIPLAARIAAVADVYDALRSERPYKPPFGRVESARIIFEGAGSAFDPFVVEQFYRAEPEIAALYD